MWTNIQQDEANTTSKQKKAYKLYRSLSISIYQDQNFVTPGQNTPENNPIFELLYKIQLKRAGALET
jgi:hypothetical protein